MLIRIIMEIALAVIAGGFVWFMAQIIYFGAREFFKIRQRKPKSK